MNVLLAHRKAHAQAHKDTHEGVCICTTLLRKVARKTVV